MIKINKFISLPNACLFFSGIFTLVAQVHATTVTKLTDEELVAFHQCDKFFEYEVLFLGSTVGYLNRTIRWLNTRNSKEYEEQQDNKTSQDLEAKNDDVNGDKTQKGNLTSDYSINLYPISATVNSYAEVTFMWLDSTYQQQSTLHYSPQHHHFITDNFTQKMTGLKSREMNAIMSNDGLSSSVTLDDELTYYQQELNSELNTGKNSSITTDVNMTLYDLDTLGAQIRVNLIEGKTTFTLFRQASEKIERYQFEVVGEEVLHHPKWGEITTIKVVETDKGKGTVLWISKEHGYQLIKAELDLIFSPEVWLSDFSVQCEQPLPQILLQANE